MAYFHSDRHCYRAAQRPGHEFVDAIRPRGRRLAALLFARGELAQTTIQREGPFPPWRNLHPPRRCPMHENANTLKFMSAGFEED